jgi:hypothetical protein
MSDSTIATVLWVCTGGVWLTVWRACARGGIRLGATLLRDAIVAARRGTGLPAPIPLADVRVPRSGLATMIAVALFLPVLYATSTTRTIDPIGAWWGVAAGLGIAGALISSWEGLGIGRRRQAALGTAGSGGDARIPPPETRPACLDP